MSALVEGTTVRMIRGAFCGHPAKVVVSLPGRLKVVTTYDERPVQIWTRPEELQIVQLEAQEEALAEQLEARYAEPRRALWWASVQQRESPPKDSAQLAALYARFLDYARSVDQALLELRHTLKSQEAPEAFEAHLPPLNVPEMLGLPAGYDAPVSSPMVRRYIKASEPLQQRAQSAWRAARARAAAPQPAQNPELEAQLIKRTDEETPYLIYADWLQEQGDPRGQLIPLQAPDAPPSVQRRAQQLMDAHGRFFMGGFVKKLDAQQWRWGYLQSATMGLKSPSQRQKVRELLEHPSSLVLQDLKLRTDNLGKPLSQPGLTSMLCARPTLQRLFIGFPEPPPYERALQGSLRELSALNALKRLTHLQIRCAHAPLRAFHPPALQSLQLQLSELPREELAALLARPWPHLRRLELWIGEGAELDALTPLLQGELTPALHHLGIINADFSDALCEVLATAPLAPQLQILDLSLGAFTERGANALRSARAQLKELRLLDLRLTRLSSPTQQALKRLSCAVITDDPEGDLRPAAGGWDGLLHEGSDRWPD